MTNIETEVAPAGARAPTLEAPAVTIPADIDIPDLLERARARFYKDDNVIGLHSESRREVLFVERLDANEDHAHATLLRLAHPLAQILVATDEVGG